MTRKLTALGMLLAVGAIGACEKTGRGEYEVQKPVIGTTTDTIHTPTVETGTVKDTINVPTVKTEKKEVTLPKVDVRP
jgi:hypothetical protein